MYLSLCLTSTPRDNLCISISPAFCSFTSILRVFGLFAGGHLCSFTSNDGVEGVLASHFAVVLASAMLMRVLVAQCAFMRGGAGGAGGGGGGAIGTY